MFWPTSTLPVKAVTVPSSADVEPGADLRRRLVGPAAAAAGGPIPGPRPAGAGRGRRRPPPTAFRKSRRSRANGSGPAEQLVALGLDRRGPSGCDAHRSPPFIVPAACGSRRRSGDRSRSGRCSGPSPRRSARRSGRLARPSRAGGGDDHAGRAVAALEGVVVEERLLERVEVAVGGRQALDRRDRPAGDGPEPGRRRSGRRRRRRARCRRRTGPRRSRTWCRSGPARRGGRRASGRSGARRDPPGLAVDGQFQLVHRCLPIGLRWGTDDRHRTGSHPRNGTRRNADRADSGESAP